jgi:Zn-dependent peptidase ImmA (M78 family)
MSPRKDNAITGIGERLRIAREGLGLSTREVAERLDAKGVSISHATLANYERGLTHPPEGVLTALARMYNRTIEWLRGTGHVLEGIRYRALKSVTVHDKVLYSNEASAWLDLYLYLESILALRLAPSRQIPRGDRSITGQSLAAEVRKLYRLREHPVPSTISLLEDFGVRVTHVHTDARIDAFAARFGGTRVVVLNAGLTADRMRLTVLHELAHHLYEDCLDGASLSHDEIEKRAFEFASHILIPSDVLKEAFSGKSMVRLVNYKEHYGISLAAMVYRARRERLITQREYEKIWQQFSRLGFRKDEPGNVAPDRPVRLEVLIDLAVAQKKTTLAQIAQQLGTEELAVQQRVLVAMGGATRGLYGPSAPNVVSLQTYRDGQDMV